MPAKIYYTEQQKQELIDLYQNQKVPISVIVASGKFPGSKDVIRRNLNNWGCDKLVEGSLVKDFQRDILEPWLAGESITSLSKKFHTNKSTISKQLKELGYTIENKQTQIKFDDTIFDSIDTEEKAYWLGFIYADGNIKNTSKTSYRLTIALQEKDYQHLVKFNIFSKHNSLNIKLREKLPRNEYVWYACSKHLWETLNSYGCTPNKSLTLQFPKESIFIESDKYCKEDLIRHFIRGYFDGDGCISYNKYKYTIVPRCSVLGTKDFIEQVRKYSGLNNSLIQTLFTKHEYFNLKLTKEESIKFMVWLYGESTIYLDRKYLRYSLFKDSNYEISLQDKEKILAFGIEA